MENNITVDKLRKNWKDLSDISNGKFHFNEYSKARVNTGLINAEVEFEYKGLLVLIHQGIFERGKGQFIFKPIEISSNLNEKLNFQFSLWRVDYFDKLFNLNRIRIGDRNFDKLICIKGKSQRDILRFFNNKHIRNLFIENKKLVLNVFEFEGKTQIKLICRYSSIRFTDLVSLKGSFIKVLDNMIELNKTTSLTHGIANA